MIGTLDSVASLLAVTPIKEIMIGTLDSVASLIAVTPYQGNNDRNSLFSSFFVSSNPLSRK
jgi:hypothetical protein